MPAKTSRSFEFDEDQVKYYHDKPFNETEELRGIVESGFFANS